MSQTIMCYISHCNVQVSNSYYSPATALKLYESDSIACVCACEWCQNTSIFFIFFGRTMKEVTTLIKCYQEAKLNFLHPDSTITSFSNNSKGKWLYVESMSWNVFWLWHHRILQQRDDTVKFHIALWYCKLLAL